jgi:hypothetical protein
MAIARALGRMRRKGPRHDLRITRPAAGNDSAMIGEPRNRRRREMAVFIEAGAKKHDPSGSRSRRSARLVSDKSRTRLP